MWETASSEVRAKHNSAHSKATEGTNIFATSVFAHFACKFDDQLSHKFWHCYFVHYDLDTVRQQSRPGGLWQLY